jgi:hypothetical protein
VGYVRKKNELRQQRKIKNKFFRCFRSSFIVSGIPLIGIGAFGIVKNVKLKDELQATNLVSSNLKDQIWAWV